MNYLPKAISLCLCFCLLILCFCGGASATDTVLSGTCGAEGSNLTWTLDAGGTLTISGRGAMADYETMRPETPWSASCDSIRNVVIEEGVTSIGDAAFSYCSVQSISIPASLVKIGGSAFQGCNSLTEVHISDLAAWCRMKIYDNPLSYSHALYLNGEAVTDLVIPAGVTEISNSAFDGLSSLKTVSIPDTVKKIGMCAFSDCTGLESFTIPDSVTEIGEAVLWHCRNLKELTVPFIGAHSYDNDSLDFFFRPEKQDINAFVPSSLRSVTLGNSSTKIAPFAFNRCIYLTSVTIPYTVTNVGQYAFNECRNLQEICYTGSRGEWEQVRISEGNDPLKYVKLRCLSPFLDVRSEQYYFDPVIWAVEKGITTGTEDAFFSPEQSCTRAQVVTFLWRAAGKPVPETTENPFTDVAESAYYYQAVLWAVEQGITKGMSDTAFGPEAICTRGQIVTFLWRYEKEPAPASMEHPFRDVLPGAYYENAVLWASEQGITKGTSKTLFSPEQTCTRAQVVTFLYRDVVG